MNSEKMGHFISELRKSQQMTQKDLAARLNITDKAVSKWERGISCPDISLLSSLAEILGVTTGELLNGEKSDSASGVVDESIDNALLYADKSARHKFNSLQNICFIAFSFLLFIGILVCAICDLAISASFTWSLIPISSIIFAWLILSPVIKRGAEGIRGSMLALSILIIPYLYVLDHILRAGDLFLPIGVRISVISVVFLWVVFIIFKKIRSRKLLAAAMAFLFAIPVHILINVSLSKLISEPLIDLWDILSLSIIVITAIILFAIDSSIHKRQSNLL